MGYLALGLAFFVALLNWPPTRARPDWIVWAVVTIGLGLSLLGPAILTAMPVTVPLLSTYQTAMQPLIRLLGESINPNILAGGLLIIVPILAALALRPTWTQRRWLPWLSGLAALWVIGIIFLTGSRGALLGVAVALILLVMLRWPRLFYALPLVLVAIGVGLAVAGPQTILDALTSGAATDGIDGLDQRVEIWSRALYALHDFVFTGIGIGTFDRVIPLLYPYFLVPPGIDIPHAHNLLLQVGVDLGTPGLIAYLALLLDLFVILGGVLRRRERRLEGVLAAGIMGAFAATLVAGVFDSVNWGSKLAFLPWLLMAAATLIHNQEISHI
jgi:putative inorganic carbon (HCO3(-)) transporter